MADTVLSLVRTWGPVLPAGWRWSSRDWVGGVVVAAVVVVVVVGRHSGATGSPSNLPVQVLKIILEFRF